ncbi:MAG: endo alpha-1,4 polygalactosaminidase [Balneolaceae bacterium]|nr:endo alpha-1,4 polygalactosaminidase [Balneolaceae bacterium]
MTQFGIDYNKITPSELKGYDLVVLEQDRYTPHELRELTQSDAKILGYFSMSEVHPSRPYFQELKKVGFLGKNENWNSYYLNLGASTARSIMLDSVLPNVMINGLDGLLLDTIDGVAPYTERSHLQDEMVGMIREIKSRYPDAIIIQNTGLFLLEKSCRYIDGVMMESLATTYDFNANNYRLSSSEQYQRKVKTIKKYSNLIDDQFYLVDYVDSPEMARQVRQRLDTLGYPYYLSSIQLDSLQYYPQEH